MRIFYDGGCPLCRKEIAFYQKQRGNEALTFVDICSLPDGEVVPGLTKEAALKRFHVERDSGEIVNGGEAFVAIWNTLPRFQWAGRFFSVWPFRPLLNWSYDRFLWLRPYIQYAFHRREAV